MSSSGAASITWPTSRGGRSVFRLIVVVLVIIPVTIYSGIKMMWVVWRKSPNAVCVCHRLPRRWARVLLWCSGVEVELENEGVIDADRPQILVANHASWYDVLVLVGSIPGRALFVAKKEIASVPVFGPALRACGHIFIDRKDRNRAVASLAEARRRLEEESPTIIMFPEGTRSVTGELQSFKKGAFVLGIQTGVDIVPAAIVGSREVMKKGSLLVRPGKVTVRFGEPIKVEGLTLENRSELTERAREALLELQATSAR